MKGAMMTSITLSLRRLLSRGAAVATQHQKTQVARLLLSGPQARPLSMVTRRIAGVFTPSTQAATALRIQRQHQQLSSSASSHSGETGHSGAEPQVALYEAPFSRPVRLLKTVSVTSATLTMIGVPVSAYLSAEDMNLFAKLALGGTVCIFAAVTTGVLHWVTKAYVRSLSVPESIARKLAKGETLVDPVPVEVETLTFFGVPQKTSFMSSDIVYPEGDPAFTSFTANGKPYFVHRDLVEQSSPLHAVLKGL